MSDEHKFAEEPLLSFIVPVYNLDPSVFKRCLLSLEDQDYPNIEVICVFDGVQPDLVNVAVPFLKNERFKVVEIEHAGACAARNAGFKVSSGAVVSFFNSDYIAKPGMARWWMEELRKNPDCGFVYGRYEYTTARRMVYPSKPFDAWLLKIANYIDCGFPVRREHVVEWDVNCKSLQDWDFWLRVVAQGVKGHYLGYQESSFMAEPPRPKGLSDDSHSNWVERVKYIKDKNGIAQPDICVASLGAPYHGTEIAKMIGADYRDDTLYKEHAYKGLYLIGWYMRPTDQGNEHPNIMMAFDKPGVNRVVHFVGADIYWLRKFPWDSMQALAGALKLKASAILCETELAQRELAQFNIEAKVVPIPSYSEWKLTPVPEVFSCAVFLTQKSDFDKYCYENTLSIIRAMPDVEFTAYGDGGWDVEYPNLKHSKNLARPDWEKFVYANSCYLRIVRHDTLPMASCEFIMAGRDVVTNIPLPFQEYIDTRGKLELNDWDMFGAGLSPYNWCDTKKAIIQRIRAIRKKKAGNTFAFDREEAAAHYTQLLDRQKYLDTIKSLAIGKEPQHADIEQQAAAISGD